MERLFILSDRLIALKSYIGNLIIDPSAKKQIYNEIDECEKICKDVLTWSPAQQLCSRDVCVELEPNPNELLKDAGPLEFTIDLMRSGDYKERFKAEYHQTKIRYDKLHKMLIKAEAGTLDFKTTCSLELLKEQKYHMGMYLHALEVRAEIEGIEL